MSIKKNIFAPLALGLGATRRAAMLLLVMMLTTTTAWATDKTLSGSESYTAQDGDVLTGSTSGTVTIADNASITLSDVTITGGIVCAGTAEITLVGTNSVTGFSRYDPNIDAVRYTAGIQVGGSGTTLTIKGDGSLTANGALHSAGIGLSRAWGVDATGGDIVIEGGNITATGDGKGAGIGTGVCFGGDSDKTATLGNITIKGGTVRAISGTDNSYPGNGIGKGGAYNSGHAVVGTITIYDGIDLVDASSISENIVYMHETTDVTESKADYFTITEDGNRRVIFPKDDTDYTITIADGIEHGTIACEATTAKLGANVTITATPDQGYIFSRLVVKDAQNNDVESTGNSFIMPRSNVSVSAIFAEVSYNGTCGNGVYYAYDSSTNTLTISGTGAMTNYNDLSERPWDGYASDIQTVVIGAGVTSIGRRAFQNCLNLATVTVYAPSCSLGVNAFSACSNLENIYVFSDKVASYKAATNWSAYATKITGITGGYCGTTDHERDVVWVLTGKSPNYTLTISGEGAMYDYGDPSEYPWYSYADQIYEVVIGNGVTSIGKYAFYGTRLTSIEIPASVTSIGERAFYECHSLQVVTFAEGSHLESIGNHAFQLCYNLTSITIPARVTSIGSYAFQNCDLASITVEDGNKVYDSRNGCNAIIVKSTNTLIIGCKNSTIPAGVTSIGERAFSGTGLTSIEIPASVTSIGSFAFSGTAMTSIEIPASVTSIGNYAFLNCPNLATVTVYAPSCSLGEDAFANCNNLANIYVFSDLVDDYQAAKNWSGYAEKITALPTVTTSYVDATGTLHEGVEAIPLNNAMTTLPAGTYVVNSDVAYTSGITTTGDVTLILADGKTMSVTTTDNHECIKADGHSLHIYGQTQGTGTLSAQIQGNADVIYIEDGTLGIHGGNVNATVGSTETSTAIFLIRHNAGDAFIIDRGTVTANGNTGYGIQGYGGNYCINGGQVIATGASKGISVSTLISSYLGVLILSGGTITASSFYTASEAAGGKYAGSIKVADGHIYYDEDENSYTAGTLTSEQITAIAGKTLRPVMGVVLTKDGSGNISAEFDGTSLETVSIPINITVNSVTLNRTFTLHKCATLMLPFSLGDGQSLNGGTLYKFDGVNNGEGDWVATLSEFTSPLKANTPYLIAPNGHMTDDKITFNLKGGTVTLNTTTAGEDSNEKDDLWDFIGTYSYIKWTTVTGDQDYSAEREAEIGKVYGFAAVEKTGIHVGDFVRVASGAKIRPMCAYLKWKGSIPNNARALTRGAANDDTELPQRITVRLVGANGEVTNIGTLDTTTGEVSFDGWYDMSGRRLSGKPSKSGLYINNGKKVAIK